MSDLDPRDPRPVSDESDPRPVSDPRLRLRAQLDEALREAQHQLAAAEETNRQLHRELEQMTASRGRRWMVGVRRGATRTLRVARHPLWTAGTVARGLAASSGPATARRAIDHLVRRIFPLRLSTPARRWSEGPDESVAIRWIGPVNLRHSVREALLCHPPAGLTYQVKAPAGSSFVCEVALSPQVWEAQPPRVEFLLDVHVPAMQWQQQAKVSIDPGEQWTDRRWHTVAIPIPPTSEPALDIEVSCRRESRLARASAMRGRFSASPASNGVVGPRKSGARSRRLRGACAPTAFAVRSSCSERPESRRTMPKRTRAGSPATRPTSQPSPAWLARSQLCRCSPSSAW